MDMNESPNDLPASHYEYIILNKNTHAIIEQIKLESFYYMKQLEGWCTESKASLLIDLVCMLNPKIIVEIGVWGGKSLIPMANALKYLGNGKIYGIDPWDSSESAKGMDGVNYDWWSHVDHNMILQGLQRKIHEFRLENQVVLIQTTSQKAPFIPNIDILHIDGNHSEEASNLDVNKWVPQVKKGGIIVFDDMSWGTNELAVKWLDKNCIRFTEFQEDNNWGMWIKP